MIRVIVLLIFLSVSIFAVSLDEAISYALDNSPLIKKSKIQTKISKFSKDKKRAENFGNIDVVSSYNHYNIPRTLAPLTPSSMTSGLPVTTSKDIYSLGLSYNVALFTGYAKQSDIEIADLAKKMSSIKESLTKQQVIFNIQSLYLTVLELQNLLKAQNSYTIAQKRLKSQIEKEVKFGKKAYIDQLKIDTDVQNSIANEATIKANLEATKEALALFVGKSIDSFEPVNIDINKELPNGNEIADMIKELDKYKVTQLNIKKSQKIITKTKSLQLPKLSLSAYYGKNYADDIKTDKGDDEELWQVGVNFKYNLVDFGSSSADIQKAKLSKISAKLDAVQKVLELKKDIYTAIAYAKEKRALYYANHSALKLAKKAYQIEKVKYNEGIGTITDLLLASSKANLMKAKTIQSRYEYQKSIYNLKYITEGKLNE